MNTETGAIYEGVDEVEAAISREEPLAFGTKEEITALKAQMFGNRAQRRLRARLEAREAKRRR